MKYKYHLLRYSGKQSRLTCPECGRHHCFTPYVDENDQIVSPQYGRCDHESSCGYVLYPPTEQHYQPQHQNKILSKTRPKPISNLCTIPQSIVQKTIRKDRLSDFVLFLSTLFDKSTTERLIDQYRLGITKSGDVIFYQIDRQGKCRTGKVMKYNPQTGRRIKDDTAKTPITWVHSLLKKQGVLPQDWELTQCLFGEHLLKHYPDHVVCLVESEKTAVICSALIPDCIWLATGGKGQLNDRVEVLSGRKIIAFPDVDGFDTWQEKAAERPHLRIIVSDLLERNATQEDRDAHVDIADLLIRWVHSDSSSQAVCSINPVFQEIQKYISSEYYQEVLALIEDFDLEVVGVKKIPFISPQPEES